MKSPSASSLVILAHLCAQARALAIEPSSPETRDITTNIHQHRQVQLLHKHPILAPGHKRGTAGGQAPTVQGGGVLSFPEKQKTTSVTATFRVPTAEMPTRGPTANNSVAVYAASFWVGVDGVVLPDAGTTQACDPSAAALRLGVDISWDGTNGGEQAPFAWYQWLPQPAMGFENFTVAPGDVVRLWAIAAEAATGGVAKGDEGMVTIENFGKDEGNTTPLQTATHRFESYPGAELPPMCRTQVACIVEDFPVAGLPQFPVALANFTSISFEDILVDGDLENALPLNIYQPPQGGQLTNCDVRSGDVFGTVHCQRTVLA